MTGYHDYLIVLSPPDGIANRIKSIKEFSAGLIGDFDSRHSKANIAVQYWPRKKPVWIEPLIPKLERDLQSLSPLVLNLKGFGYFDHQTDRTIYAGFDYTPLAEVWFKHLRKFFSKTDFIPHITIAKSIPQSSFDKLWPHFRNREWNEQVKIDKLTILRREMIGHDKSYKVFKDLYFNSRYDFSTFANAKLKAPPLVAAVDRQQISLF